MMKIQLLLITALFGLNLLSSNGPFSDPRHHDQFVSYFKARGVLVESKMHGYIQTDLSNLVRDLNLLFKENHDDIINVYLGSHVTVLGSSKRHMDHIGRELFGPIQIYLNWLTELAPKLGLKYLRHQVFPSTQVVKVLQSQDPNVRGVTIGRIYFSALGHSQIGALELFQVALLNGDHPQDIRHTFERVYSSGDSKVVPIEHVSIELNSIEAVNGVQKHLSERAQQDASLKLYQESVSYNPGDGSTNTKFIIEGAGKKKIVELVHYGDLK